MFLKLLLGKAVEWGRLGRNPAVGQRKFAEPEGKIKPLADNEAKRLILAAMPHLKPILEVLLSTGMRKTEALKLKWAYEGWDADDANGNSIVDLEQGRIFIPGKLAKNHKDREIPLSLELLRLFRELREKSETGLVFNVKEIRKSFRAAVKTAKIKRPVRIHDLRHTAASRMIEAGIDVVTVCEILGHSDLKITLRYCHSSSKTKRDAVEKLSRTYLPAAKKGTSTRQNMTTVQIPKPVSYRRIDN
jgi:integrase